MFYQEYLASELSCYASFVLTVDLCHRRQWPAPAFICRSAKDGVMCIARVNNREYCGEVAENERLAREDAAMQAYWRCQNFSRADGRHPHEISQANNPRGQGRPVAIGTERNEGRPEAQSWNDESSSSSQSFGDR